MDQRTEERNVALETEEMEEFRPGLRTKMRYSCEGNIKESQVLA